MYSRHTVIKSHLCFSSVLYSLATTYPIAKKFGNDVAIFQNEKKCGAKVGKTHAKASLI